MQNHDDMSTEHATLEQLDALKKTASLNSSIAQSDFNRMAASHFAANVVPQLKRFEDCLREQGIRVNLLSTGQSTIRATLAIERPSDTYNLLIILYDFASRSLIFETVLAGNERELRERYTLAQLGDVTPALVYEIIEEFVSTLFNSDSLCEYDGEENELLG
jgi:hypothetical protein